MYYNTVYPTYIPIYCYFICWGVSIWIQGSQFFTFDREHRKGVPMIDTIYYTRIFGQHNFRNSATTVVRCLLRRVEGWAWKKKKNEIVGPRRNRILQIASTHRLGIGLFPRGEGVKHAYLYSFVHGKVFIIIIFFDFRILGQS